MTLAKKLKWLQLGLFSLVLAMSLPAMAGEAARGEDGPAADPAVVTGADVLDVDSLADKPVLPAAQLPPLPAELDDPAFEKYVDIRVLGRAWSNLDASGILDVALQLAEGERVLLRSHKALSSDQMFSFALTVAIETQNEEAFARLQQAAEQLGQADFTAQITVAQKLMAEARSPTAALSIDEFSAEEITGFKATQTMIRSAKISSNKDVLDEIFSSLERLSEQIPEPMVSALKAETETALASLDSTPADPSITVDLLDKLGATTRGGLSISPISPRGGVTVWRDTSGTDWAFWGERNPSTPWNHRAAQDIIGARMGGHWRLPHIHELRSLWWPDDHRKLGLRTGPLDFYWTSDPGRVMCPFLNGFQTALPIQHRGNNYIIAVW